MEKVNKKPLEGNSNLLSVQYSVLALVAQKILLSTKRSKITT